MQTLRTGVVLLFLLTMGQAAFGDHKVTTDYDRKADFSSYKTFMWLREPRLQDPLMVQRVKDAVNAQLTAKGWQLVTENADIAVSANGATRQEQTLETWYSGYPGWQWHGLGHGYGSGPASTRVETYTVGTLVVDLFDTSKKQVVYRATASDVVSDKPEKNTKTMNKVIEKMFKHFPPKSSRD